MEQSLRCDILCSLNKRVFLIVCGTFTPCDGLADEECSTCAASCERCLSRTLHPTTITYHFDIALACD